MFVRGSDGVYRSRLLLAEASIDHGFGSRTARNWPGRYIGVRQVHSNSVVSAGSEAFLSEEEPPRADAIVSREAGKWIGVRTADCVPILLADPIARCVAAVHAGWRGTAENIVRVSVSRMAGEFGSVPANLLAALGPCIGRCCFEVGPEVSVRFEQLFPEALDSGHVDLAESNRRQLLEAGLSGGNIDVAGLCTFCEEPAFESWRRDRERSGRMVAAIALK